jgi:hypothetical protein
VSIVQRLTAIVLVLLMQGPAMLLQEVAWVGMLVTYTQERGLKRGVIETFDGRHPCNLCNKAEQLRQQELPSNPDEKKAPAAPRPRLAWAEMVAAEWMKMPVIAGYDIAVPSITFTARNSGTGTDGPIPPPPEVA